MNASRLSKHAWSLLSEELFGAKAPLITPPHKLFLWNAKGVYIDYHYPDTNLVHYVGGELVLGKRVTAVLPDLMGKSVRAAVLQTFSLQLPLIEHYELCMQEHLYRVIVRFLPFQNNVLGLVTDYPHLSDDQSLPRKALTRNLMQ